MNYIQISIFDERGHDSKYALEKHVNNFLTYLSPDQFIDIKYYFGQESGTSMSYERIVVIYKTKE